jgi:hypothetical protein
MTPRRCHGKWQVLWDAHKLLLLPYTVATTADQTRGTGVVYRIVNKKLTTMHLLASAKLKK